MIHCKEVKLSEEFHSDKVSPYLKAASCALAAFALYGLDKKLVITSVLRKPEDQVKFCRDGNFKSEFQHCAGEAVDIRSSNLSEPEIEKLLDFATSGLSALCNLKHHAKGTGRHLHLNVVGKFRDKAKVWAIVKNTDGAEKCFVG